MIIRHCGKGGRCSYAPRVPAACPKPALSKPQSSNAKAISHASPLKEALRRWRKIEEARQGNVAMTTERRGEYRWLVLFAMHAGILEKEAVTDFVIERRRELGFIANEDDEQRNRRSMAEIVAKEFRNGNEGWWTAAEEECGTNGPFKLTPSGVAQLCQRWGGDNSSGDELLCCDGPGCAAATDSPRPCSPRHRPRPRPPPVPPAPPAAVPSAPPPPHTRHANPPPPPASCPKRGRCCFEASAPDHA